MSTYVPVPAATLAGFLVKHRFHETLIGKERVFTRASAGNPNLVIAVYSSASVGATEARGCGEDAIRVVLLARGEGRPAIPLFKGKRIHRTGSVAKVLGRVLERVLQAVDAAQAVKRTCGCCGAPAYTDSGRCIFRECRTAAVRRAA